jgi:hypothetical protein
LGVFTGIDPLEGEMEQIISLNRYSYVGGNPTNVLDPLGLIFWSFPSTVQKKLLFDPITYKPTPTRNCPRSHGHPLIERWMEKNNGYLKTQLEFPGGGPRKKMDTLVFDGPEPQPPIHRGGVIGYVYEIAPINPLISVARDELDELDKKFEAMRTGKAPFTKTGHLPKEDFWPLERGESLGEFAGAKYDWSDVFFERGAYLSKSSGFGPVEINPNQFGGVGLPADATVWAVLALPGLVLFTTSCEIRETMKDIATVTAADAAQYFLKRWREAQKREREGWEGYKPLPEPVFAASVPEISQPGIPVSGPSCPDPLTCLIHEALVKAGIGLTEAYLIGQLAGGGGGRPCYRSAE